MANLINYQAATRGFYNPYASQYGVGSGFGAGLSGFGDLASLMPGIGPLIGAGMNMLGTFMQNRQQEAFFNQYMSPAARMQQMRDAGINPNAAAQGISGASAPQMNAAAPTSAFSGLGEQLGNSVNTALTADSIIAETRMKKEEAKGLSLDNAMKEIDLGMKPDLLSAELDDLRESANQKRQDIENSKKEIEKMDAEIDKLKEEKEYIIAQEGLVEYEKKLKEAETNKAKAETALKNAEKQLTDVNKEIQEKERDNYLTPEERITKTAEATPKAQVSETPQGRLAQLYEEELNKDLAWIDQLIKDKSDVFGPNHVEVRKLRNMRDGIIRKYRNRIRRINKGASAGFNVAGTGINAGG